MKQSVSGALILVSLFLLAMHCPVWPARAVPPAQIKTAYERAEVLDEPRIFAEGVISTADYEGNATFTPDGKTFYFTKRTVGYNAYLWAICVSHFVNGRWGAPEVAAFSGQHRDSDPFISPAGKQLFFISDRPANGGPRGNFDIWVMDKTATGWSEPRNLGDPVNTPAVEYYPSVAADGTLYFCSDRQGGKGRFDIYRARLVGGKYTEPENLGEAINTRFADLQPCIAPDQSFLVFASAGRSDETLAENFYYPRGDLYLSYQKDGVWTLAKNLGPKVNTAAAESRPNISPDGKYLLFTSERGFATPPLKKRLTYQELLSGLSSTLNGLGNIYQISLSALE
jgi:Tol biopolymer transport system component